MLPASHGEARRPWHSVTARSWLLLMTIGIGMMMPLAAQQGASAHGDVLLNGDGPPSEILIRDDLAAGKIDY
ncbi:MAG: hypothetical protein C4345_12950, partial [Chloroflexota bacterium]